MAVGYASTTIPGFVLVNAPQAAALVATNPQTVLDDSINGSQLVHLGGKGAKPTVAPASGAGTAATAVVDANATDLTGTVTLVTGSAAWVAGTQAVVTFAVPHTKSTYVVLTPADSATAALWNTLQFFASAAALTGFNIGAAVADGAAHTLNINYAVAGV